MGSYKLRYVVQVTICRWLRIGRDGTLLFYKNHFYHLHSPELSQFTPQVNANERKHVNCSTVIIRLFDPTDKVFQTGVSYKKCIKRLGV